MSVTGFSSPGVSPHEAQASEAIVAALVKMLDREYPPGTTVRRDAHPKHHGLVRATFIVGEVPADLRHGLFAAPASYDAWIRFSNGSPRVQPDRRRDQRGMAIKLVGVAGDKVLKHERHALTQDFVLASAPRFFIRDARDYAAFTRAAASGSAFRVLGYFLGPNPLRWRLHELKALAASLQRTADLLDTRYYSQVPYRLGPQVVKYSARSSRQTGRDDGHPATADDPDFLRKRLVARLRASDARFDFLVQRRRDPDRMPIDDATVEWAESLSPFERVATIEIPRQTFDEPAQNALAEYLSFTPWHTLPAHEPVGAVNRLRLTVYEALSRHRHRRNGVVSAEPVDLAVTPPLSIPNA
jgi:catalase